VRLPVAPGVTIGLIAAVALLPVWIGTLSSFRGSRWWLGLGAVAVVAGGLISALDGERTFDPRLFVTESLTLLSMLGIVGTLLWARTVIGSPAMAIAFGTGYLASTVAAGLTSPNNWKYDLSLPVSIIALGAAALTSKRLVEILVLIALAGISVLNDSRSITAFFMIAAAFSAWQIRGTIAGARPRAFRALFGMAALAFATYSVLQALILDGFLGSATQQRTQVQIDSSGSLIAGGRPELGAAFALITGRPLGYGNGVVPTAGDVLLAKTGMSDLNYDPNNGYVEHYMFGGQYEVHSVLGDLWIRYGLLGAAFVIATLLFCVIRAASNISVRTAPAVMVFLTALLVWDSFFSPFLTSYRSSALAVALLFAFVPVVRNTPSPTATLVTRDYVRG
jgi:hypothetical protein